MRHLSAYRVISAFAEGPLSPLPIEEPFGRVHIDHIGRLPKTPEGYRHLLVVVDLTTLWCEAFPRR